MRVFDCIMVEKESDLDLLEARMTELEGIPEVVHVICEASADYSGNPKGKHFLARRYDRFWRWHGRWNHVEVEPHEIRGKDPRSRKDALREYLAHGVHGEPSDVILHGSIDEIPSARAVRAILDGEVLLPVGMEMRWCAYTPRHVHPKGPWKGTVAQEWRLAGSFAGMREKRAVLPCIVNAGTRLSMMDERLPDDGRHPDGHVLWETEPDDTWPEWTRREDRGLCE